MESRNEHEVAVRGHTPAGLPRVMCGRGPGLQPVAVPDGAFASVLGHLEILRQLETIGWTRIFAEATEHAARSIVDEGSEDLPARGLVAMPADYDEILRAGQGAKIAGDAERFAGLGIDVETG